MGNLQKMKQAAVKSLERDVANLDASDLEILGHRIVELLEEKQLIHRGLNRDGKPVGYTVDTFSGDRTVIAEYSTEQGYFEKDYHKLRQDCQHARQKAPSNKKLYLISNQPCDNSAWPTVSEAIVEEVGDELAYEPFDARRLATVIYDQVLAKNNLVEYFADSLPSLWTAWTEHVVSNSAPETPRDFIHDEARANVIVDATRDHVRVAVQGISGTGKTYSVIEYVKEHSVEYRNTVWIGGEELAGVGNFAAVESDA